MGIPSAWFIRCNPNLDVTGPFDGLLFLSPVGFAGLALVHCVRWFQPELSTSQSKEFEGYEIISKLK
jgi:hypothetical protein